MQHCDLFQRLRRTSNRTQNRPLVLYDYNILINQVNNCIYHGLTLTATYGIFPTIVEVHGEAGYTLVRGVNIFDVAISIADFMSK